MRFGTSFFDKTVFKKTILRYWPLWGAYSAIWLLTMPLSGLMRLRMDAYNLYGYPGRYIESFAQSQVPGLAGPSLAQPLAVIFGALCAMAVFSHLCNPRSANFFGGLPVRREGLFLTHYLAGLAFLLVPNLVVFLLTLLVELAGSAVFWPGLLFWLAATCGECFFFYTLAVFCGMFTGQILAMPAFYAIVNMLAIGLTELVAVVFRGFYYGFDGFPDSVYAVVKWLTPVEQLSGTVRFDHTATPIPKGELGPGDLDMIAKQGGIWISENEYVICKGLGTVGVYAVVALALAVCAFLLYRARKLESAGDVVSVKAMRPVFQYGVAFCAGLSFGMLTSAFLGGGEVTLMISILIWGVVGYFAARMMLDKTFRVFHRWRGALAVAAVFTALFAVVAFDLTGYEAKVPDPSQVAGVHVSNLENPTLKDYGDHLDLDIDDPEVIRLITVLHQAAVDQRDGASDYQEDKDWINLRLSYTLKGGGALERRYGLWVDLTQAEQEGTAAWALQGLYDNRELFWRVYTFDRLEELLSQGRPLTYAAWSRKGENPVAYAGQDALDLLAAVKEDFFANRIGVRRLENSEDWYAHVPEEWVSFTVEGLMGGDGWYVEIALQDTASSTLALLAELDGDASPDSGTDPAVPDTAAG